MSLDSVFQTIKEEIRLTPGEKEALRVKIIETIKNNPVTI